MDAHTGNQKKQGLWKVILPFSTLSLW